MQSEDNILRTEIAVDNNQANKEELSAKNQQSMNDNSTISKESGILKSSEKSIVDEITSSDLQGQEKSFDNFKTDQTKNNNEHNQNGENGENSLTLKSKFETFEIDFKNTMTQLHHLAAFKAMPNNIDTFVTSNKCPSTDVNNTFKNSNDIGFDASQIDEHWIFESIWEDLTEKPVYSESVDSMISGSQHKVRNGIPEDSLGPTGILKPLLEHTMTRIVKMNDTPNIPAPVQNASRPEEYPMDTTSYPFDFLNLLDSNDTPQTKCDFDSIITSDISFDLEINTNDNNLNSFNSTDHVPGNADYFLKSINDQNNTTETQIKTITATPADVNKQSFINVRNKESNKLDEIDTKIQSKSKKGASPETVLKDLNEKPTSKNCSENSSVSAVNSSRSVLHKLTPVYIKPKPLLLKTNMTQPSKLKSYPVPWFRPRNSATKDKISPKKNIQTNNSSMNITYKPIIQNSNKTEVNPITSDATTKESLFHMPVLETPQIKSNQLEEIHIENISQQNNIPEISKNSSDNSTSTSDNIETININNDSNIHNTINGNNSKILDQTSSNSVQEKSLTKNVNQDVSATNSEYFSCIIDKSSLQTNLDSFTSVDVQNQNIGLTSNSNHNCSNNLVTNLNASVSNISLPCSSNNNDLSFNSKNNSDTIIVHSNVNNNFVSQDNLINSDTVQVSNGIKVNPISTIVGRTLNEISSIVPPVKTSSNENIQNHGILITTTIDNNTYCLGTSFLNMGENRNDTLINDNKKSNNMPPSVEEFLTKNTQNKKTTSESTDSVLDMPKSTNAVNIETKSASSVDYLAKNVQNENVFTNIDSSLNMPNNNSLNIDNNSNNTESISSTETTARYTVDINLNKIVPVPPVEDFINKNKPSTTTGINVKFISKLTDSINVSTNNATLSSVQDFVSKNLENPSISSTTSFNTIASDSVVKKSSSKNILGNDTLIAVSSPNSNNIKPVPTPVVGTAVTPVSNVKANKNVQSHGIFTINNSDLASHMNKSTSGISGTKSNIGITTQAQMNKTHDLINSNMCNNKNIVLSTSKQIPLTLSRQLAVSSSSVQSSISKIISNTTVSTSYVQSKNVLVNVGKQTGTTLRIVQNSTSKPSETYDTSNTKISNKNSNSIKINNNDKIIKNSDISLDLAKTSNPVPTQNQKVGHKNESSFTISTSNSNSKQYKKASNIIEKSSDSPSNKSKKSISPLNEKVTTVYNKTIPNFYNPNSERHDIPNPIKNVHNKSVYGLPNSSSKNIDKYDNVIHKTKCATVSNHYNKNANVERYSRHSISSSLTSISPPERRQSLTNTSKYSPNNDMIVSSSTSSHVGEIRKRSYYGDTNKNIHETHSQKKYKDEKFSINVCNNTNNNGTFDLFDRVKYQTQNDLPIPNYKKHRTSAITSESRSEPYYYNQSPITINSNNNSNKITNRGYSFDTKLVNNGKKEYNRFKPYNHQLARKPFNSYHFASTENLSNSSMYNERTNNTYKINFNKTSTLSTTKHIYSGKLSSSISPGDINKLPRPRTYGEYKAHQRLLENVAVMQNETEQMHPQVTNLFTIPSLSTVSDKLTNSKNDFSTLPDVLKPLTTANPWDFKPISNDEILEHYAKQKNLNKNNDNNVKNT